MLEIVRREVESYLEKEIPVFIEKAQESLSEPLLNLNPCVLQDMLDRTEVVNKAKFLMLLSDRGFKIPSDVYETICVVLKQQHGSGASGVRPPFRAGNAENVALDREDSLRL